MEIPAWAVEKHAADGRQHGVAEIAVQRRHRARLDATPEAIAHDQRMTVAQLRDKRIDLAEIVAVVGIAHDHEPASCRADASQKGAAVAFGVDGYDASACRYRDYLRPVGAAVVSDQHLAFDAGAPQKMHGLCDAGRQRL